MVMAGTAPNPTTDVSLSARLQWLQQRRDQLQEKLALKNNELKSLCLDEAELTGVLPPEIPLEPGESPPAFRKRVDTCRAYPQNLINRLKTNEAEESALELERQVQVGIAETSLGILNDPAESKTVRRKHRSLYQQSQRRLRELDARLSFIRQAYGRIRQSSVTPQESLSHTCVDGVQTNAKHRSKKPRPPLENPAYDASPLSPCNILQESGVSLSPLGIEIQQQNQTYAQNAWSPRGYRGGPADDDSQTLHLASDIKNFNHTLVPLNLDPLIDRAHRKNVKYTDNDLNDNHDIYILPDRHRQRTYSQGNNSSVNATVPKYCQDTERTYRTIPNTYTEEERQMRYRAMQQKRQQDSHNSRQNMSDQQPIVLHQKPPLHHNYTTNHQSSYLDNQQTLPAYYQSDEFVNRSQSRYATMPDDQRLTQRKSSTQIQQRGRDRRDVTTTNTSSRSSKTNLQECTRGNDGQLPAGYWIRENDEIVWCPDETPSERFGSLDRRKYGAHCNVTYNPTIQTKERGNHEERERYGSQHNHALGTRDYVLGLAGPSKFPSSSAATSHHHNYNSQVHQHAIPSATSCYERISPSPPLPRTLLRTQSLGSVETWQQQQQQQQQNNVVGSPEGIQNREISQSSQNNRDDAAAAAAAARCRVKEKEWYETSMDSSYSVSGTIQMNYEYANDSSHRETGQMRKIVKPSSPHQTRQIIISTIPPAPPPLPSPPLQSSNSREIVVAALETRGTQGRIYPQNIQQQRHPPSPKSLEIPAESKRRNVHAVVDEQQIMNTSNNDRSPDICTIVQAGKYQPYREVTKPFEMSDFYKYSTKYRKRNEAAVTSSATNAQQRIANEADDNDTINRHQRNENTIRDDEMTNLLVNPVQRRIYEPVQRMTCQPYGNLTMRQPVDNNEEDEWRGTVNKLPSSEDSTVV